MFRIRPTGIYAAGSRVGNYPRHKTIPWNARHAAFRLAHFRYVITSILSQSRHRRVCPAIWRRVLRQIHGPLLHLPDHLRMRLSPINYAPFPRNQKFIIAPYIFGSSLLCDRLTPRNFREHKIFIEIRDSKKDYFIAVAIHWGGRSFRNFIFFSWSKYFMQILRVVISLYV